MDYIRLKQSAIDTLGSLEHIDPAKMTKEQFLLCGAATAILDHIEPNISRAWDSAPRENASDTEHPRDGIPYAEYVADELRDADKYWHNYKQTKNEKFKHLARQEMAHAAALLEEIEDKNVMTQLTARLRNLEKMIR